MNARRGGAGGRGPDARKIPNARNRLRARRKVAAIEERFGTFAERLDLMLPRRIGRDDVVVVAQGVVEIADLGAGRRAIHAQMKLVEDRCEVGLRAILVTCDVLGDAAVASLRSR